MSDDRKQMAVVLEGEHRLPTLQEVARLVDPDVSSVLDIGCGSGTMMPLLKQKIPSASIIGIDKSQYLLREVSTKKLTAKVNLVLGKVPIFPFKAGSFDLIIAVQSLHEVYHFMGEYALKTTIEHVYDLLEDNASFIVLDHENPGTDIVCIRLPLNLFSSLESFKMRFRPREIVFERVSHNDVEMPIRDFYDFVTKIWALNTPLEEEEMNETHTEFTGKEFVELVEDAGMSVMHLDNVTSISSHLKRYGIRTISKGSLPGRHFILRAEKQQ